MMNVAIVQPILSPNRIPVFERLAQCEDLSVKLFILHDRLPERPGWAVDRKYAFEVEKVDTFDVALKSRREQGDFSEPHRLPYGLLGSLIRFRPHAILTSNATETLFCSPLKFLFDTRIGVISGDTLEIAGKSISAMRLLKRYVYRLADFFCAYGEETRRFLTAEGIAGDRIVKTNWAVDNDFYGRGDLDAPAEDLRERLGRDKVVFVTVGQLVERKGIRQLISAWNTLPDDLLERLKLVVIGAGPLEDELNLAAKSQPRADILLPGHLPPAEIAVYYRAADVFIFPTLEDIWGLVVNEAMASGLPVLCSRYAGCRCELVNDGVNGFSFDPLDPSSIVKAISVVGSDEIRRKNMAQESRRIIADYSFDVMTEQILSMLRSCR